MATNPGCHQRRKGMIRRQISALRRERSSLRHNGGFLDRMLLCTAVTRAVEQVVLVGDRSAFERALTAPPTPMRRDTGLSLLFARLNGMPPAFAVRRVPRRGGASWVKAC